MDTGKLNKRIQLFKHSLVDGRATKSVVFVPSHHIWANVVWISDGERIRAASVQKKSVIRVTIRNSKALNITNLDQIAIAGNQYGIEGIKPNEDETFLEITLGSLK